jgi:hypothetical protein
MSLQQKQLVQHMPDGRVYVQDSEGGAAFYTFSQDAYIGSNFNEASDYARQRNARMPTPRELNIMFNLRAAIGGFAEEGVSADRLYWTSYTVKDTDAMVQDMGGGLSTFIYQRRRANLRLVRDV